MEVGKAFTFAFEDPRWVTKILVGGLVTLAAMLLSPIIIGLFFTFVLYGYGLELMKNVRDDVPNPLPEWENWGDRAVRGLKLVVVFFIWLLPAIVLSVFMTILSVVAGNNGELEGAAALLSLCASCITFLWSLVVALFSPAILIRFAEHDTIGSGFAIGEIWALTRAHLGDIIVALLVSMVALIVASIVGALLCGIGLLFTWFWGSLVEFHLFGQIARKARSAATSMGPAIV
ncbi:MAG: hypothetical protein Kow0047_00390 [Anaerolineae bacterium]